MDRRQLLLGMGATAAALSLPMSAAIAAPPLATTSEVFAMVPASEPWTYLMRYVDLDAEAPSVAYPYPRLAFRIEKAVADEPVASIEAAERSFAQSCAMYEHTLDLNSPLAMVHLIRCGNRIANDTKRGWGNKILVHRDDYNRVSAFLNTMLDPELANDGLAHSDGGLPFVGHDLKRRPTLIVANHGVLDRGEGLVFYSRLIGTSAVPVGDGPGAYQDGFLRLNLNASGYGVRFKFI